MVGEAIAPSSFFSHLRSVWKSNHPVYLVNGSREWFSSYLTGRTQSISVNGTISEPMSIQFGVPQGSVLGPLLFIMCINDLPLVVKVCSVELYADDTLIFFAGKSVREIESQLSSDLDSLISWFRSNFLMLILN